MLLKAGIALMSAVLLMAVGTAFYVFPQREEPVVAATKAAEKRDEPMVAATKAAEKILEPTLEYDEPQPQRVPPEKAKAPQSKAGEVSPEPAPEPKLEVASKSESQPEPEPEPQSEPKPSPEPEPQLAPEAPTVAGTHWPAPTEDQVAAANKPRHYRLPDGAVMGLTIKDIGVFNAPIFDTSQNWALDSGVRHVPETSMPWSGGAQRNVYLEGHRLGYPGTGSHLIFYNLDRLRRGDEILLKNRDGKRYAYRVSDSFVVDPSESWVMGQIRGRDMVTLQTCTGPGYSQRLIVRAERI